MSKTKAIPGEDMMKISDIKGVREEWGDYFIRAYDRATAMIVKHGEPYELIAETSKAILVIMRLPLEQDEYFTEEIWLPKKWLYIEGSD